MKFSEVIKSFCAWKKYSIKQGSVRVFEGHLRHFCLFLRNPDVSSITWGSIQEYLDVMSDIGWDKNAFNSKCMAFKIFFDYCKLMKIEALDPNVVPLPEREYSRPKTFAEEDYVKLLNSIPEDNEPAHLRNRALIKLLADSGMRIGEALSLNFEDLDLINMSAVIKTEKTTGPHPIRKVFWTLDTNLALKLWITRIKDLKQVPPDAVFFSTEGRHPYTRISASGIREFLTRYSKRAGIDVVHSHLFRHRYGLNLAKRGANTHTIMNLMGHSNLNSSMPYTIMAGDEMANQYDKFFKR